MKKKDINSINNPNFKNGKYVKVNKICLNCGKDYIGYKSSICCSKSCGSKYSKENYTKCEICGKNIPYWKHQRFCSYVCSGKNKSLKAPKNKCKTCNKEIVSWMNYCNFDCYSKSISLRDENSKRKQRNMMLNGGAARIIKFITNPSKPEVMLRDIVKELYPNCEFQYQVFNYALDVAIPEYKIAIEYDGWYHFDCQENIDYHIKRQEKIEEEGWKFIRYNIFSKFPSKEQIYNDIQKEI